MASKSVKKSTQGRRKIPIEKIEKKANLQVTFTKRRKGLFRKACQLALLCGVEVALIVQSPAEKIFTFEEPSVEALINRLAITPPQELITRRRVNDNNMMRRRSEYEGAAAMLEAEKEKEKEKAMAMKKKESFWWDESVEGFQLHEMEEFLAALEGLREDVDGRVWEFERIRMMKPIDQEFNDGAASTNSSSSYLSHPVGHDMDLFEMINNIQ